MKSHRKIRKPIFTKANLYLGVALLGVIAVGFLFAHLVIPK